MKPIGGMPYYGVPGVLYVPFLLTFFWYTGKSIYLLFSSYGSADHQKKAQIFLVGIGTLIGFVGGSTNYLPWFGVPVPPFLNCLVAVYVIMTAYAIVKHKFLDIEILVKKTLVFAGLFGSVYAVFAIFAFLGQVFFEKYVFSNRWLSIIPSIVIVTFMFRPLESFLINITNKYLFQKKYDYKDLLKTFTSEVLTVLDLDRLVNLTINKLDDIIKLASCSILLFDNEKCLYIVKASKNLKDPLITLDRINVAVKYFEQTHRYLLRTEFYEKNVTVPASILSVMDRLSAELIIPMVLHDKVIG
ncbi:MAG: hypothetical protein NC933_01765, partial [Candidatus Omnitrophica bacterium]|nr:hypothetical protein [Candidatus Omnitrophota bacterium]